MKRSLPILFALVSTICFLCGCASYTERGTWTGTVELETLYEKDGTPVQALCLAIDPGEKTNPVLKWAKPILTDRHLRLIAPGNLAGKRLKIWGLIDLDIAINPADQKPVHDPSWQLDEVQLLRVNVHALKIIN